MPIFNPCPKPKTVRLNGAALAQLRLQAYARDNGMCVKCGSWVPLRGNVFTRAHMAHKKSRGAGGGDVLENVEIKCYECHIINEHTRGIK